MSEEDEWFTARKRPVAIQARGPYYNTREVDTLEGQFEISEKYANKGYYIIEGVNGEVYPCRKDIFHETYEVME